MEAQVVALGPELQEPVHAMRNPVLEPLRLFGLIGLMKYSISICSNSRVRKMKFSGVIVVAERFAHLRDAERQLDSLCILLYSRS